MKSDGTINNVSCKHRYFFVVGDLDNSMHFLASDKCIYIYIIFFFLCVFNFLLLFFAYSVRFTAHFFLHFFVSYNITSIQFFFTLFIAFFSFLIFHSLSILL